MSDLHRRLADVRLAGNARRDRRGVGAIPRACFQRAGIDAPQTIVRRNADMPAVPGGIRDGARQGDRAGPGDAAAGRARLRDAVAASRPAALPDLLGADGAWAGRACAGGRPAELQRVRRRAGAALFQRDLDAGERGGHAGPCRRRAGHPARPHPRQALRLQQPRFHVRHHRAVARSRSDGRKPRHLLRAHRDRRASRLDRRGRRGQGGCLRDRLPLLAHGQAPRAEGQGACRSSAGPACARACR